MDGLSDSLSLSTLFSLSLSSSRARGRKECLGSTKVRGRHHGERLTCIHTSVRILRLKDVSRKFLCSSFLGG